MLRRRFLQGIPALIFLSRQAIHRGSQGLYHRVLSQLPKDLPIRPPVLVSERGHLFDCSSCVYARDGKNIVTGGIGDDTAILWDATTGKELRRFNHGSQITDLAIHPKLNQLLTCGGGGHDAQLWELSTGAVLQRFRKHTAAILSGTFDFSGESIYTIGEDCLICVWSPRSSKPRHCSRLEVPDLTAAAFDKRGAILVGRFTNKTVKMSCIL